MTKTTKYNNMLSSFQCDFTLALEKTNKLADLDKLIKNNNPSFLNDIKLLEELERGLRYGKLVIMEVDENDNLEEQIIDLERERDDLLDQLYGER